MRTSLVVLLLVFTLPLRSQQLFRSNALGMRFEAVGSVEDSGHVLRITVGELSREEVLFESGEAVRRTVTSPASGPISRQEEYENGVLATSRVFDAEELLVEEVDHKSGQTRNYRYDVDRLVAVELVGESGEPVWREDLRYSATGRLREVVRSYPDGRRIIMSYNFGGDRLVEERLLDGENVTISRYDDAGRLARQSALAAGEPVRESEFRYDEPRGGLLEEIRRDLVTGEVRRIAYDGAGRAVAENTLGASAEAISYNYDSDGRRIGKRRRGPEGIEEWDYIYDADGELVEETYRRRGFVMSVTAYTGERSRTVELYRAGRPVLRIYYEDDRQVREEPVR
jgi:hypothetical protein